VSATLLARFAAQLFGGVCYLCAGKCGGELLCAGCEAELPRLAQPVCPRCALPAPAGAPCGACQREPPAFDASAAAFAYAFPADVLVHALKFQAELALAPYLAQALARTVADAEPPELIVPVPLAPRRLAERGFNQALEIARPLARARGAPLEAGLLRRARETFAQSELPRAERRRNVRGAFCATRPLAGETVALVDDVMTSGATLQAAAAALKAAGAGRVWAWVVARALPPGES